MSRAKIIFMGGVIIAVIILLATLSPDAFFRPDAAGQPSPPVTQPFTAGITTTQPLLDAFVPGLSSAPLAAPAAPAGNGNTQAAAATATFDGQPVTSLNDVQNIINTAQTTAPQVSGVAQLLALPNVPDSELAIDPAGAATIEDYLAYANSHSQDISFQSAQFNSVLKDANGVMIMPTGLVALALADNNFAAVHNSLAIFQKYYGAKIAFEKTIKVTGDAAAFNKKIIGFDELSQELIQKDFDVEAGNAPTSSLQDFYNSYLATAASGHEQLLKDAGVFAAAQPKPDIMDKLFALFDLRVPSAEAVGTLPFGGQIGVPIFCICDMGYWVTVGPPTPPALGSLFVPIWVIANPLLFYPYHSLAPGSWWLGLYYPATVPCLQFVGLACAPIGLGNELYMAGTSLPSL